MRKLYILGLIALAAVIIGLAWAEEMKFTTYYPAPYGVYREMVTAHRLSIGDVNGDGQWNSDDMAVSIDVYGQSTPIPGSLTVAGNVGIGTTGPNALLNINGRNSAVDTAFHLDTTTDRGWEFISKAHNSYGNAGYDLEITGGKAAFPGNVLFTSGNVGIGTTSPTTNANPRGDTTGNLDVNDVWLRGADGGAGAWASVGGGGFDPADINTTGWVSGSAGYTKFPNGLIMKWGTAWAARGGTVVTFASAFPNAVFQVMATPAQGGLNSTEPLEVTGISKTRFTLSTYDSYQASWFAIGR